jgi:dihydroorotate dehydrogenase
MPDWFYRTVSRPLLFRLPAARARDLALGFMGRLARLPLGPALIDFLGHMRADDRLRVSALGISFPSPIGLGPGLDANAVALPALARFGVGFLEVGPVTVAPVPGPAPERRPEQEAIWVPDPPDSPGLDHLKQRLRPLAGRPGVPLLVRLSSTPGATPERAGQECARLVAELAAHAAVFSLATLYPAAGAGWAGEQWQAHLRAVLGEAHKVSRPLLVCVPADLDRVAGDALVGPALELGAGGVLVDGTIRATSSGRLSGLPAREPALAQVRHLRQRWGQGPVILASGGLHEPEDALALREAGADLVEIDSGLVYTGPGLPKRSNDVLLYAGSQAAPRPAPGPRPAERTWFWTTLMGAGMLIGSVLALGIAATRVVLPYDEAFVGRSREQLAEVNPRLLAFMAHDRVSLAGTMIAIGVLYLGLSLFGVRRGWHWAQQTVFVSAFSGFATFFLFLGFGYLDTFHAFVTAVLFQFLLLGLHADLGPPPVLAAPALRGDWRWRWSLWGQLLLIGHAVALLTAGVVIAGVGVTQVFVQEDLEFMGTTASALRLADPRLVPLIAHDRATFGGMLVASGLAFLLGSLWGFRPGSGWLWWTFLAAGVLAYASAIGVHYAVGYTSPMHLAPAFAGLAIFLLGLGLSYPFLVQGGPAAEEQWRRRGLARSAGPG